MHVKIVQVVTVRRQGFRMVVELDQVEISRRGNRSHAAAAGAYQGSRLCITSGNMRHPKHARFVGSVRIK